jgi:phosphoglycolate phosphatase-like HAD superfamily hydrolase
MSIQPRRFLSFLLIAVLVLAAAMARAAEPLHSWNDGAAKSRILGFVQAVTDKASKDYVAPADRIAVFDNDGTLWSEQPAYFQLSFAIDRVRAMAPKYPQWKKQQPFKAVLDGDMKALAASGERGLLTLLMATHAGLTSDEFTAIAGDWLASAKHPKFRRPYTELAFQPMLELLDYLRANGFKTYIVSGGGIEFLRVFSERAYGIPPEQVIGSSIKTRYEARNGQPVLVRLPEIDFIDDKAGKPVGIQKFIGKRPIAAFGNSDGDFEMLEWVTSATGPRLGLIVHHDDADREFAYDRASSVGRLDRALDEAPRRGWTVTSIKSDWKTVYPAARP